MKTPPLELRFDPQTIRHLGLRMYSTLPPALSEIIANSYDADATYAIVKLVEENDRPFEIRVEDDGIGMSYDDINNRFLVIGRNRRIDEGDKPSPKYKRLPIGKKGLGKLALFGLAKTITITTNQSGTMNKFILNWDELMQAEGTYRPRVVSIDKDTTEKNGTIVSMTELKRKTPFDVWSLVDSLSRTFIFNSDFYLKLIAPNGEVVDLDSKRKYDLIEAEFEWDLEKDELIPEDSVFKGKVSGKLITSIKPITPASGLRGITLFSRGKLVNAPEFFSASTSSHFFQYLTGWIRVDFIDELDEDVISTNRQSVDWEHPEMVKLRGFLSEIVSKINNEWRNKRKDKKEKEFKDKTGIDKDSWVETLPADVKENTLDIINTLNKEDAIEKYVPVIKALYNIVPEYPLLHWRHLHIDLKERVKAYYENQQFGEAASQGVLIFCEKIRLLTGRTEDGYALVNRVFSFEQGRTLPEIQLNDLSTHSKENIQVGQGHLSRGVITGFRNPILHDPIDTSVPAVFSELDCLNILSLISYLITRMDNAIINNRSATT